jgi:uncharacterized protein DUF6636
VGRALDVSQGLPALLAQRSLRLAAVALGALALLVGCGSTKETRTTVVTVTDVATVTAPAHTLAQAHDYGRFQMPSRNVGCAFESGTLRCDILSGLVPEPSGSCELDWTGFVIDASGPAEPECAGDTVYDGSSPVLAYGEGWARQGILCVSRQSGLRCMNADRHGFELARQSSRDF